MLDLVLLLSLSALGIILLIAFFLFLAKRRCPTCCDLHGDAGRRSRRNHGNNRRRRGRSRNPQPGHRPTRYPDISVISEGVGFHLDYDGLGFGIQNGLHWKPPDYDEVLELPSYEEAIRDWSNPPRQDQTHWDQSCQDRTHQDTTHQDQSRQHLTNQHTAHHQDIAHQDEDQTHIISTHHLTTNHNRQHQYSTQQDTTYQDTTNQDTTHQDLIHQYTTSQDQNTTNQDQDTSNQDQHTTHKDQDTTHQDQDTTHRDQDTTHPDQNTTHLNQDQPYQDLKSSKKLTSCGITPPAPQTSGSDFVARTLPRDDAQRDREGFSDSGSVNRAYVETETAPVRTPSSSGSGIPHQGGDHGHRTTVIGDTLTPTDHQYSQGHSSDL